VEIESPYNKMATRWTNDGTEPKTFYQFIIIKYLIYIFAGRNLASPLKVDRSSTVASRSLRGRRRSFRKLLFGLYGINLKVLIRIASMQFKHSFPLT